MGGGCEVVVCVGTRAKRANRLLSLVVLVILVGISGNVRGPEGKVISQKLHDDSGVLVRVLREVVQLSNGIIERLLRQLARLIGGSHDLIVEHREVEGKTETDGVGGRKLVGNVGGGLVSCRYIGKWQEGKLGKGGEGWA